MAQDYLFENSVSLSVDTSIVVEPGDTTVIPQAGSAFVFQRIGSNWVQAQHLVANDPSQGAQFGTAVAISGDVAVIGTPHDSPLGNTYFDCGSAYIFERVGTTWTQTAKIWAADPQATEHFAEKVAISGDRILIAARDESHAGLSSGAAYVFERPAGVWVQVAKLVASDATQGAGFGQSVSIYGDFAVIGAPDVVSYRGTAYVFQRLPTGWTQTQEFTASDVAPMDYFGFSVAISMDTLLVGSAHSGAGAHSGVAYVFQLQASTWIQMQELVGSDTGQYDAFGNSGVAIFGDTAICAAADNPDPAINAGAAYAFQRVGSTWTQTAKLSATDGKHGDLFGNSISISGHTVFVGAFDTDDACPGLITCNSGSAYAFEITPDGFQYGNCTTAAPCGNFEGHGGCRNSTTLGGVLGAGGSGSVAADDLLLVATRLPPHHSGILFMGGAQVLVPFGDGVRTVGSGSAGMYRFPVQQADSAGMITRGPGIVSLSQQFPTAGHITAGQTWNFEYWYRDPQGPCGGLTNFSNSVQIAFVP
jgi:hypothetical protein